MKRKLAVLLSVLLCAFGLTACSSSSASDTASEDMAVYKTEAVALIDTLVNEQKTLDELRLRQMTRMRPLHLRLVFQRGKMQRKNSAQLARSKRILLMSATKTRTSFMLSV